MSDWTPTGRRRHRSQTRWGGREELVLQVEERGVVIGCVAGMIESDWGTRWRDATTADITTDPSKTRSNPETLTAPTVERA